MQFHKQSGNMTHFNQITNINSLTEISILHTWDIKTPIMWSKKLKHYLSHLVSRIKVSIWELRITKRYEQKFFLMIRKMIKEKRSMFRTMIKQKIHKILIIYKELQRSFPRCNNLIRELYTNIIKSFPSYEFPFLKCHGGFIYRQMVQDQKGP